MKFKLEFFAKFQNHTLRQYSAGHIKIVQIREPESQSGTRIYLPKPFFWLKVSLKLNYNLVQVSCYYRCFYIFTFLLLITIISLKALFPSKGKGHDDDDDDDDDNFYYLVIK